MGIRDTTFVALFDKEDIPDLYKLAEKVRKTHEQSLVDNFNLLCQKKIDDHNPILELGNKKIEFLQVMKNVPGDLVVDVGMQRCLDLILGVSVQRWARINVSTGNAVADISNTALSAGGLSVQFAAVGWAEYAGPTLKFGGVYGESMATLTPREAAIFNDLQTVMLNRTMFQNNNFTHTVNVTGFVISNIIEFVPVMS